MRRAWHALAVYAVIALVVTWPLARGLGRDVAWDLGDPVFVMWALAWDCEQLLAILRGDVSRLSTFFDANIFHPAPLTLAYSEHFVAQALQVLPIYALTRNPILCYNLLFLSTFVLSGLGMYLLVRALTANPRAAFVAGLLFAFAPYRLPQSSHLQVLSAQWMPFALLGLRRFFDAVSAAPNQGTVPWRRAWRPLVGAAAALIAQNLSCAYYLLYFSPFVAAYVIWELVTRHQWRQWKVVAHIMVTAVIVAILTVPFLLPYAALRRVSQVVRARGEVVRYSADVYSYATTSAEQPLWGSRMRAFPKAEGDLFPGFVALALAAVGVIWWPRARLDSRPVSRRRVLGWVIIAVIVTHVAAVIVTLASRRVSFDLWLFELRISNINQLLIRIAVLVGVLLAISPETRLRAREFLRARGLFALALLAAVWLSLGPSPQALGRPLELTGIYNVLYEFVPGFEGLRVPARFAMIAVLMLAVLAGYGASTIALSRAGRAVLVVLAVLGVAEGIVVPFTVNGTTPVRDFNAPEPRVRRAQRAPAVYHAFAREPATSVLAELPLGQVDYDLRAVFYSTAHWRKLLNGYSGFFPPHYGQLTLALADVPRQPDLALTALRAAGATHVLVHEGAWLDDQGPNTSAMLRQHGASELFRDGHDVLLKLP